MSTTQFRLVSGVQHNRFHKYMYYKMLTTRSIVTICHNIKLLQYYWLYSLYCTFLNYSIYNWKFVSLYPLHLCSIFETLFFVLKYQRFETVILCSSYFYKNFNVG